MRGASMAPFARAPASQSPRIHAEDFVAGWETCGRAAVRAGSWKIVFIPKPKGPERWQLYDLSVDPGEIHDLAEREPATLQKLVKLWDRYVLETGVVPLSPALGAYLAATEAQMPENAWMEYEYWKEGAREEGKREEFFRQPPRFRREVKPF